MDALHLFATATLEQMRPAAESPLRPSLRLESGQALTRRNGNRSFEIKGTDSLTSGLSIPLPPDALDFLTAVDRQVHPPHAIADVRFVTRRRALVRNETCTIDEETFAVVSIGALRGVVDPEAIDSFATFLHESANETALAPSAALPYLFTNGSASVLFHEAVGHPAEVGAFKQWPEWLRVMDTPPAGLDDVGDRTTTIDALLEPPRGLRRFSWRDLPLQRMSHLEVTASEVTAAAPDHHIEVLLVDEGSWDTLSDTISLNVLLAYEVKGSERRRLAPFRRRFPLNLLPASIDAASLLPTRYPGVICSLAGHPLRVTGSAPDILVTVSS